MASSIEFGLSNERGDLINAIQFIKNRKYRYINANMITNKYPLNQISEAISAGDNNQKVATNFL